MAGVDLSNCKRLLVNDREFFFEEKDGNKQLVAEKVNQTYLLVYPKGSYIRVIEEGDTLRMIIDE